MSPKLSRVPLLSLVLLSSSVLAAASMGCELIATVDRSLIDAPPETGSSGTGGMPSSSSTATASSTAGSGGMTSTTGTGGLGGAGGTGGMTGTGGSSGFPYPTDLTAVINGPTVNLTWVKPDPATGNTVVKLVRTLNTPPTGPTDASATAIYTGSLEARAHALSALLPDMPGSAHTYHYAVYGCTPAMVCETMGSSASITPTLRQCLIGGGYNLFWRHASADVCIDNLSCGTAANSTCGQWWKSCDSMCPPVGMANARQLNANGVTESQSIGQSFDTIGIPVGRVLSSEFCRCMQTAQYMDFGPTIEQRPDLTYYVYNEASRCNATMALLAQPTPPNQNVALISHAGNICPPLSLLDWGEAAIYKPDGAGGSILITRVLWDAWDSIP